MIQDICVSDQSVFWRRSWASSTVLSRARALAAPHSQPACMEKGQKPLQHSLKNSSCYCTSAKQSQACEITQMLPENVNLPAQRACTCSVPAVCWGKGYMLSTPRAVATPAAPKCPLQYC